VTVAPPAGTSSVNADGVAFHVVRDVCRRHTKDFFFASAFLPRHKRDAVHTVYAFCRMIEEAIIADDAAVEGAAGLRHHPAVVSPTSFEPGTGCGSGSSLQARLGMLRDRLDEIYDGRLELPRPEARSRPWRAQVSRRPARGGTTRMD